MKSTGKGRTIDALLRMDRQPLVYEAYESCIRKWSKIYNSCGCQKTENEIICMFLYRYQFVYKHNNEEIDVKRAVKKVQDAFYSVKNNAQLREVPSNIRATTIDNGQHVVGSEIAGQVANINGNINGEEVVAERVVEDTFSSNIRDTALEDEERSEDGGNAALENEGRRENGGDGAKCKGVFCDKEGIICDEEEVIVEKVVKGEQGISTVVKTIANRLIQPSLRDTATKVVVPLLPLKHQEWLVIKATEKLQIPGTDVDQGNFQALLSVQGGENWIRCDVIDAFLCILRTHSSNKIHCFTTKFSVMCKDAKKVDRFFKKIVSSKGTKGNPFELEKLFFPINIGPNSHWSLVVVYPGEKKVIYFDSLPSAEQTKANAFCVKDYILREYIRIHQTEDIKDSWSVVRNCDAPTQINSDDCGVFVCMYAYCLSVGIPVENISPLVDDVRCYRQFIAFCLLERKLWSDVSNVVDLTNMDRFSISNDDSSCKSDIEDTSVNVDEVNESKIPRSDDLPNTGMIDDPITNTCNIRTCGKGLASLEKSEQIEVEISHQEDSKMTTRSKRLPPVGTMPREEDNKRGVNRSVMEGKEEGKGGNRRQTAKKPRKK